MPVVVIAGNHDALNGCPGPPGCSQTPTSSSAGGRRRVTHLSDRGRGGGSDFRSLGWQSPRQRASRDPR